MGIKISQMTETYFLRGGVMSQQEKLEIAANIGDTGTPATYSANSQDIAALSAPYRFIISETDTLSINDDSDQVVTIAKIPMTEVVRELIRYGLYPEYDPNDPFNLPRFNTILGGTLRFNIMFKVYENSGTYPVNNINIACDIVGNGTTWSISGLSSKGGSVSAETLPLPYPDVDNNALWPSHVRLLEENEVQYIQIIARVNLGERDSLTIQTLGSIDGVFFLYNFA